MFVAVLAFVLQSYVTQTHIHTAQPSSVGGASQTHVLGQVPGQSKSPLDNSPVDCPFCQAIAFAGFFVIASPPLLHLPFAWVETDALIFTARTISRAITHDWQSRAPPRR